MFASSLVSKNLLNQAKITAEGIVEAYNLTGLNAVGITGRDLAAGIDYLHELVKKSDFAWLSANIVSKDTKKPVFKPFTTVDIGTDKAALIGLIHKDMNVSKSIGTGNDILSWDTVLPDILAAINDTHDFIVLLTDLPDQICKEIAKKHGDINLIIRAAGSSSNMEPQSVSPSALLCSTGKQGKHIGIMTVTGWQKGSTWSSDPGGKLMDKKRELDRLDWQIGRYQIKPELKGRTQKLLQQKKTIQATIDRLQEQVEKEQSDTSIKSPFTNRFLAMHVDMPDDQPVLNVVNQIKLAISALGKKLGENESANRSLLDNYAGWRKCGECHPNQLRTWQNSRHARAYLTLLNKNQQFNQKCVFCHVTGVTEDVAVNGLALPPELQHVGCESCHGAGLSHIKSPLSKKLTSVTEKTCTRCHVPDHDEDFEFKRDIDKLHCSKDAIKGS